MPTEEELLAIKERAAARLMALPSVTGVGIGGRMRGGQPTGELVLKVYVKRKLPANEVDPAELVPAEIEGIPTDVSELAESGELTARRVAKSPKARRASHRRQEWTNGASGH